MFSIIIPFKDGHDTIHRLIESVPETIEILIVDDQSDIPLSIDDRENVKVIKTPKRGYFAGAVNLGISSTKGDVLILNQDIYFTGDGWIEQLNESLEAGYGYIGESISGTRKDWPNGYIHGTYMYLTREVIDKTGLLNEVLFPMWGCTAEYQLRVARNNFKVLPLETVRDFVHVREGGFGQSFQKLFAEQPEKKELFTSTPPLVSVIIPTHNYSQFLKSTVNCLVGGETDLGLFPQQTFAAFEVVIVDDSSTDDTPEIIKELVDPWKGVRSIRLDRPRNEVWDVEKDKYAGKVVAVNAGIRDAFGKYILTIDADDMMWSDRMERLFNIQIRNQHSFVYDDLQFFNGKDILTFHYPDEKVEYMRDGRLVRVPHPKAGQSTEKPQMEDYDFDKLIWKNHVHSSIMFPKSAGLYPERFRFGREDWAMAVNLGLKGYCGIRDRNNGFLYRRSGHNRTLTNTNPEWMKFFQEQMVAEFGNIYRGHRPDGCCGRSYQPKRKGVVQNDGTVELRYNGYRSPAESFTLYGFATGKKYKIKLKDRIFVDERDLIDSTANKAGILQKYEKNREMFLRA